MGTPSTACGHAYLPSVHRTTEQTFRQCFSPGVHKRLLSNDKNSDKHPYNCNSAADTADDRCCNCSRCESVNNVYLASGHWTSHTESRDSTTELLQNAIPLLTIQLYLKHTACKAALNKRLFRAASNHCIIQLLSDASF